MSAILLNNQARGIQGMPGSVRFAKGVHNFFLFFGLVYSSFSCSFGCSLSLLWMLPRLLLFPLVILLLLPLVGESCVYSTARRMQFLCKQRHKFQWLNNKTLARADKAALHSQWAGGCRVLPGEG